MIRWEEIEEDLLSQMNKVTSDITNINRKYMEAALIVHFLGILNTMRLIESNAIDLKAENIYEFLETTIEKSVGIKL